MAEGGSEENSWEEGRDEIDLIDITPTKEQLEYQRGLWRSYEDAWAIEIFEGSPVDPNRDVYNYYGDVSVVVEGVTPNLYSGYNRPPTPPPRQQTPNEVSIGGDSATNAGLMDSSTPNDKAPRAKAKLEFGDVGELDVDSELEISQLCDSLEDLDVAEDDNDKPKTD